MENNKLLYRQIMEYLIRKINNQELQPHQQLPTELELAEQFQVSRITSRRALIELEKSGWITRARSKGSFVKPRNAEPLGIRPDTASGMQNMIAILIPDDDANVGMFDYILGATDFLSANGYHLSIHTYEGARTAERERKLLSTLPTMGIKGIIYYPKNVNRNIETINTLHLNGFPLVTIDKYFDLPISYVVSDDYNGGYQMVSHLVERGHRRIAFASRSSLRSAPSIRDRYFGYCRGLKDHGLDIDDAIVQLGFRRKFAKFPQRADFYKHMIERLLRQGVTAIQVANDTSAIVISRTCLEMGIKIPEQLSITGFDDLEITRHLDIPLTTVAQDFRGIGRKAAEVIVNLLENGTDKQEKIVIPVRIVVRKSSGSAVLKI